ncbi:MAG TPA: ABC transporter permease [Bryobacteraceae bacterium]|nr:ABC transporter permease [Bryobacteraceae bacterium]
MRRLLDTLARDLGYAARTLRRNPGFAATVVLTLGLGIGATTAIFTVVNAVLLRPLPYPDPDRLVYIAMSFGEPGDHMFSYTMDYPAWKDHNRTLSQIAGYRMFQANFTGGGEAERITGAYATRSLFSLLGVHPMMGRTFLPEEDRPGGPPVAILSHAFWKRRFGGDPSVIGKALTLDASTYTVIGVLPATFLIPDRGESDYDLWVPFAIGDTGKAKEILVQVIGRLKPGVGIGAARSDLEPLMQQFRRGRKRSVVVSDWHERVAGGARRPLLIFLCAVSFVLLIACVNVANLLLSRAAARDKEMAVRRALGAGKGRVLQQLLTESILLGLLGGIAGLALAFWGKNLLIALISRNLPALAPIGLDYRVLAFNLGLGLLTGVAFGLAPALQASQVQLNESLKEAGRSAADGRSGHHLRNLLVVFEVALAMVLLCGAGLLLKSFLRMRGIDPGYRSDRVLTLNVNLTFSQYPKPLDQTRFFQQAIERIKVLPGVQAVGAGTSIPLGGYAMSVSGMTIEGKPDIDVASSLVMVSPDYLRTLGIPLVLGRSFGDSDREGTPSVLMVNESFAHRFFPGESCLGGRIQNPARKTDWTIVGVVRDIRPWPEVAAAPEMYLSYLQAEQVHLRMTGGEMGSEMGLAIRTAGDPMSLAAAVRSQLAQIDKSQPVHDVKTLEERRAGSLAPRRVNMLLVVTFAALALILGSIGIYGVVSYSVGRRTHEIGVRMALGAHQGQILGMVLRNGMGLIAAGVAIGLLASAGLTRLISSELWEVSATDPWTFAAVVTLLAASGFAACLLPAWRAARVEPTRALRYE